MQLIIIETIFCKSFGEKDEKNNFKVNCDTVSFKPK